MINLLPTDSKSEIRAARTNVILLRYIGIIVIAIAFLMGVLYVSYTILQQTMTTAEGRIATNDTKADVYSATKQEVDALSAKLSDTKAILDQEVSYATILTSIGQAMPAETILDSLTLDDTSINSGAPITLTAYAKNESSAPLIQQQLRGLPIFASVELVGSTADASISGYPIKVSMTATFNRSAL